MKPRQLPRRFRALEIGTFPTGNLDIGELSGQVGELTKAIGQLVTVTNEDATAIRTMARIGEAHEKRIARPKDN